MTDMTLTRQEINEWERRALLRHSPFLDRLAFAIREGLLGRAMAACQYRAYQVGIGRLSILVLLSSPRHRKAQSGLRPEADSIETVSGEV